ncbi:hypothetical protein CVT24_011516 [Panaeolus cyanescens]|uniref:Copper radical oxidase n=1 Tax=Panaeolus cyanescens TaxID=181874 RepID=A0A409VMH9_9AGAR|nr:hypothetical protein CVT24_011516 [Panaeolus cyanescens]
MQIGLSLCIVLICQFLLVHCKHENPSSQSAWNGLTPTTAQSASKPEPFTPYYVPPGAKSYDSSSPFITYKGQWIDRFSSGYVGHSLRSTTQPNAEVLFTFNGTGIEWFGNKDNRHGYAIVFLDGDPIAEVDAYVDNAQPLKQQRIFWKFDLPLKQHTIKIVNLGRHSNLKKDTTMDLDVFVVTRGNGWDSGTRDTEHNSLEDTMDITTRQDQGWVLTEHGSTGVNAMQLAVVSESYALIVDKVEHNPLTIDGHPAWAALYNLRDDSVIPLRIQSNSFCAGGSFLSNGTLINVGGNPVVEGQTSASDFGDLDGLQAIRIFEPCEYPEEGNCELYENPDRIRMASPRWYSTAIRLHDGSVMIIGGSKKGGWINNSTVNNPTIEFFPPKAIHGSGGLPIALGFLETTLNANLFPIAFVLPDGKIFMAANQDAMIYDWETNTEILLPKIPNGVRVTYPMSGTGLLLPLSSSNDYTPEILLCGGSTINDKKASYRISSQDQASSQCSRMVLTEDGINEGWQVEQMPDTRIMPDAVLLPTGKIVIINGGRSGIAGYGNVLDQVGYSNADNPVFTPVLYDPDAEVEDRFMSEGLPTSSIPRLYHSVASLTPSGNIMIAGSNPNLDRSEVQYGTEYRVEWLDPPYMQQSRPVISDNLDGIGYVALMDLGFVTHAVHTNSRLVYLECSVQDEGLLSVTGPPNTYVYPPGPGWLYVVADEIPSVGIKIMVGSGQSPEVDDDALQK